MIDVRVADIMRREVERVEPDAPLEAVVERLRERRVSCVVVCDGDTPVGIISAKDTVSAKLEPRGEGPPRTAADVMTTPVHAIASSEAATRAATALVVHSVRQLPVVDASGALLGLVAEGELLRACGRRNEQLEELSTIDPVTGLYTRRTITEVLEREWGRARRHDTPLTVLMADLDHFKQVNDTYGHVAGDAVLRGVSQLLARQLRGTDVAGRYGGEEILVVLSQSGTQGGAVVAERWREAAEGASFRSGDVSQVSITVSIGVAALRPDHRNPEQLVHAADSVLYRAKNLGRNRVEIDEN